jgi:RNA recognition motif-containing protein
MGRKIFVGNLAFDTTNHDLQELFGSIGTCDSATVVTDRDTGRSRGFGFVEMSSAGDAQRAISELNGREVHGRALRVSEANERPSNSGSRGPRRGY